MFVYSMDKMDINDLPPWKRDAMRNKMSRPMSPRMSTPMSSLDRQRIVLNGRGGRSRKNTRKSRRNKSRRSLK
jgi:hypothetical protein